MYMHEILRERRDGERKRERGRGRWLKRLKFIGRRGSAETSKIAVARRHGIEMNLNSKLRERAKNS